MGNTFGRAPKFVSIGYFCGHLVTSVLLIELCPMVPFIAKNTHGVSQPTLPYSVLIDHRNSGQSHMFPNKQHLPCRVSTTNINNCPDPNQLIHTSLLACFFAVLIRFVDRATCTRTAVLLPFWERCSPLCAFVCICVCVCVCVCVCLQASKTIVPLNLNPLNLTQTNNSFALEPPKANTD